MLLKVSPMKSVICFGKRGELNPRFISLFEILQLVGPVDDRLALPSSLSGVHLVFHVSMLKKFRGDGNYTIHWDSVLLDERLSFVEEPISNLLGTFDDCTLELFRKLRSSGEIDL